MSLYVSGRNKIGIPTFPILEEKWINRVQRKLTQKKEKNTDFERSEFKRVKKNERKKNEREKEEQKESENSLKKGKQTIAQ